MDFSVWGMVARRSRSCLPGRHEAGMVPVGTERRNAALHPLTERLRSGED